MTLGKLQPDLLLLLFSAKLLAWKPALVKKRIHSFDVHWSGIVKTIAAQRIGNIAAGRIRFRYVIAIQNTIESSS